MSKVHKLVPSIKGSNAKYHAVIMIFILATENRRFNQHIGLNLSRASDDP